jgi:hypothetical protein
MLQVTLQPSEVIHLVLAAVQRVVATLSYITAERGPDGVIQYWQLNGCRQKTAKRYE